MENRYATERINKAKAGSSKKKKKIIEQENLRETGKGNTKHKRIQEI